MSVAIQKRLKKELNSIIENPIGGCTVVLEKEDDIRNWIVRIPGPKDTPYEEGVFNLKFSFPELYPFKAPEVKFITQIYHPNVKLDSGEICLDVFTNSWLPTQTSNLIIEKLISILQAPSVDSPLEPSIAEEYTKDISKYIKNAKEYTLKYAKA